MGAIGKSTRLSGLTDPEQRMTSWGPYSQEHHTFCLSCISQSSEAVTSMAQFLFLLKRIRTTSNLYVDSIPIEVRRLEKIEIV